MKRFLAIGLIAAFIVPNMALAQIDDKYDRFTQGRTLTYKSEEKAALNKPMFAAHVNFSGSEPISATLALLYASLSNRDGTSWTYLSCHSVRWLVNGVPLQLGGTKHDGRVSRGGVTEIIMQDATIEQLRQIGSAASVEYRICNDEYRLAPSDIAGIRRLVAALDGREAVEPVDGLPTKNGEPEMKYRPRNL